MHTINKLAVICLFSTFVASCDQVLDKTESEYLKIILEATCGEEDPACIAAVDGQFDSCHSKYEDDWDKYMNSSSSQEDKLLSIYMKELYGCIVDQDGDPYIVFPDHLPLSAIDN
ncbi:MAG: hypothetical protein OFPII_21670 [Osedax symbiont Rs1]|nr:MAG: hypothetical protein OFPII_21670 [Osedax symbiont Rs1]